MKEIAVIASGLAIMTLASAASAQESLGQAGQIAIQSDLQLQITSTSYSPPAGDAPDSTTTIIIQPALDYFVMDGLSVGGSVAYASISQGDDSISAFGIGPRVGYALSFTESIGFWPKLGFTYMSLSLDSAGGDASGSAMQLNVFAPLTISPAEHFFIGIGPVVNLDLSREYEGEDVTKETTIGLATQVGGYF